jgi:parallel beta-helix repeat protein
MKRIVSGMIIIFLLMGMLALLYRVQRVEASGTIYIRADGSIDPPTAPISSVDNVTYTFADNINDSIVVERDNIVVDGAGCTVQGNGTGTGIDISGRNNVTITKMNIQNFSSGIHCNSTSLSIISRNNITNNEDGIEFESSSNNTISGNNITNNDDGIWLYSSSSNSVNENNIANKLDGIYLGFSSNVSIGKNNITNNNDGIGLRGE